uniref:CAAX prenyl protease 2 n=1 Tax=Callorhinchus milii TaxID=7868 RepID=A0A4W3HL08_CALMI
PSPTSSPSLNHLSPPSLLPSYETHDILQSILCISLCSRDHPTVIKRRFTSVLIVSALSPLGLWIWREYTGNKTGPSLLSLMGFRLEGALAAASLPLLLTMVNVLPPGADVRFWVQCVTDMRWLRNQVVAPLTEELVFRACMLPMLVPCTGLNRAIFTCPLFFGVGE